MKADVLSGINKIKACIGYTNNDGKKIDYLPFENSDNLKPIYKPDRPQEVKHATCSADKARKLLNYKTTVDLKTGITKTFDYIKKRGVKPFDYYINVEIQNELTPSTWIKKEI